MVSLIVLGCIVFFPINFIVGQCIVKTLYGAPFVSNYIKVEKVEMGQKWKPRAGKPAMFGWLRYIVNLGA